MPELGRRDHPSGETSGSLEPPESEASESVRTGQPQAPLSRLTSLLDLKRIGHITPSCNSAVEALSALVTQPICDRVTHHFNRISVGDISLDPADMEQFDRETMLLGAAMLTDAAMDAIVWNGTSGSWNGPEADREICDAITAATGLPASTSTLAQLELFAAARVERFGLAVPYTDDVTARMIATYRTQGLEVVSHANLGIRAGRDMAYVPLDRIRALIRDADDESAECIAVVCTGLPAALVVEDLESELGKPVYDSVLVTLWSALTMVGIAPSLRGWGSLLRNMGAPELDAPAP